MVHDEEAITRAIAVLAEAQAIADEVTTLAAARGPGPNTDEARSLIKRAHDVLVDIEQVSNGDDLLRRALAAHEYARMALDEMKRGA